MYLPLIIRTIRPEHCDPLYLLRELGVRRPYCALLESVDRNHASNDRSFLALGARDVLTVRSGEVVGSRLVPDASVTDPLQPFEALIGVGEQDAFLQMGYIGFLSYESVRCFEAIDLAPDPSIPDAVFVLPEVLLHIDHEAHEIVIIAHEDTKEDLDFIERTIHQSPFFDDRKAQPKQVLPINLEHIESFRQTKRGDFCAAVGKAQEGILDGETFQVVLSQELRMPQTAEPHRVYEQLRSINPSPYMYYFQTPERVIVGASPETLLRVNGREMFYRPIAGTRKRTGDAAIDCQMCDELLNDPKERCEHQMLVDLGRNDVGRVAEIGSVEVHDPFHIEQYAHVYHIVSDVTARLHPERTSLDALRSVFPAGTLTGAPKLRAMEVIRDLERSPRGIYGGAFGYIDLSGNLDLAITIRTMLFQDEAISLRVGAGVVKDSVPELEDNECLHKARSCLAAVSFAQSIHSSASSPSAEATGDKSVSLARRSPAPGGSALVRGEVGSASSL